MAAAAVQMVSVRDRPVHLLAYLVPPSFQTDPILTSVVLHPLLLLNHYLGAKLYLRQIQPLFCLSVPSHAYPFPLFEHELILHKMTPFPTVTGHKPGLDN